MIIPEITVKTKVFHNGVWVDINKYWELKNMDIKQFTKAQGTFLKAEDVKEAEAKKDKEPVFVITGEATLETNEKFNTERLYITGDFLGEEKTFDSSKTNARVIEETLGSDTSRWIGKSLLLETYRTKTSEGKMVDAINVKEVRI